VFIFFKWLDSQRFFSLTFLLMIFEKISQY